LTAGEKEEWETVKRKEMTEGEIPGFIRSLPWQYPKAARHYLTLFPNNYLDPQELSDIRETGSALEGLLPEARLATGSSYVPGTEMSPGL